jgi:hypothetical protein
LEGKLGVESDIILKINIWLSWKYNSIIKHIQEYFVRSISVCIEKCIVTFSLYRDVSVSHGGEHGEVDAAEDDQIDH